MSAGISYNNCVFRLSLEQFKNGINIAKPEAFLNIFCCDEFGFRFCGADSIRGWNTWDRSGSGWVENR